MKLCGHAWGRCNEGTMEKGIPNGRWNISIFVRSYWRNLQRLDTCFRKAIKVEKRLAIVIWRLSTGNSYRSVSKASGVGKFTVIKIFLDGINHIVQLTSMFIKFPVTTLETPLLLRHFKSLPTVLFLRLLKQ